MFAFKNRKVEEEFVEVIGSDQLAQASVLCVCIKVLWEILRVRAERREIRVDVEVIRISNAK